MSMSMSRMMAWKEGEGRRCTGDDGLAAAAANATGLLEVVGLAEEVALLGGVELSVKLG